MCSEFAGRNAVYERNYEGNQDQQRLDSLRFANMPGDTGRYKDMVQQSLNDYYPEGWKKGYNDKLIK
jgi:4-hydroxyphenylacetate 3-monooxygenase